MTIQEFIKSHKDVLSLEFKDKQFYALQTEYGKYHRCKCYAILTYKGQQTVIHYDTALKDFSLPIGEQIYNLFASLILDVSVINYDEYEGMPQWMEDIGYKDALQAHKIWNSCWDEVKKLRRLFEQDFELFSLLEDDGYEE